MQWKVDFLKWNGRTGQDSQIVPWEITEIDANAIHPAPAKDELFPTKAMAEKWAQDRYPVVLAEEADRLRDVTSEHYGMSSNRGLRERHEFIRSETAPRSQKAPAKDK